MNNKSDNAARLILGGSLIALTAWYLIFIFYGPALPISHDELNFLFEALRLPAQGRLTSYGHGPVVYELIALLEGAFYIYLRAIGSVHSLHEFLISFLLNQAAHVRLLRAIVGICGLGLVIQVYRVALLFSGRTAAALSALFVAGNLTFIAMSSQGKEDVFFWLFTFIAMERSWRASIDGRTRDAVIAGAAIGLAFSTKYLGVFAGLGAALPILRNLPGFRRDTLRQSGAIALSAAATVLVLFPFLLTDTKSVLNSIHEVGSIYTALGTRWTMEAYLFSHLPNLVGWPIFIVGTVELFRRWTEDPRGPILVSLIPAAGLLFIGLRIGFSMAYYAMPAAILLIILASSSADRIKLPRWRNAVQFLLAGCFVLDTALLSGAMKHAILLTGPDTRETAAASLVARARPGDRVLINQAVLGENVFGPALLPMESEKGHGPFTLARAAATARLKGPRYRLTILNYSQDIPADAASHFDWLIVGRRGRSSVIEYGTDMVTPIGQATIPEGFKLVETIQAVPEQHTHFYPYLTTLDYEALRAISVPSLWRIRALGLTFDLYERLGRPRP